MKKTTIVLEIEHKKDLPAKVNLTDVVAQRIYGFLYSQGCEAGVRARMFHEEPAMDTEKARD